MRLPGWLAGTDGSGPQTTGRRRNYRRLALQNAPPVTYAIGDVHGCLDLLQALERQILEDARAFDGERLIVMLGDYIDRGPRSAQVLDHLVAPPPSGFSRVCLAGNHEHAMLSFLSHPSRHDPWLEFGGHQTLASYGIDLSTMFHRNRGGRRLREAVGSYVPDEHISFLESLPILLEMPDWIFAHAGLRPGVSPERQSDHDLLGIAPSAAHDRLLFGKTVVHGHTVCEEPLLTRDRIAIDTGAYFSGRLTAVRLVPEGDPVVLQTGPADARQPGAGPRPPN